MVDRSASRNGEDSSAAALRILRAHSVLTLATVYRGEPHAVSLMYANEGFTLYWLSDPRSRHSQALADTPRASITVAGHFADFREIEGLQFLGAARKVGDKSVGKHGLQLMADRYEFLQSFLSGPAKLVRSLDLAAVYRFEPDQLTLIDNTKGFGHKEIVSLPVQAECLSVPTV